MLKDLTPVFYLLHGCIFHIIIDTFDIIFLKKERNVDMTKEEKAMINRDYAYEEYGELCYKIMFNDKERMELTLEELKFLSSIGAISIDDEELKEELEREETLTTEKYLSEKEFHFIPFEDKDDADIFYGYVSEYMIENGIDIDEARKNALYATNNLEEILKKNKGLRDNKGKDLENSEPIIV